MAHDPHPVSLSRREFVTIVGAFLSSIMGLVLGLPLFGYLLSPALKVRSGNEGRISMGLLKDFPVGEPTPFSFTRSKINGWEKATNSYTVFVLRKSDTDVNIYSNVCPHLSCRVNWQPDSKLYICPCHDAHFNSDGQVVSGPSPRPLELIPHEVDTQGNLVLLFKEA